MSLMQTVYSILLVSASDKLTASLTPLFPGTSYFPVHRVKNSGAAKRVLSEKNYDIVIINSPLPDESGEDLAIEAGRSKDTVVLYMVSNELYEEVYSSTSTNGIFTLPKPFSKQTFSVALRWLSIIRERMRTEQQKELTLEEKMSEIRLVNRAKWLLISELKMDEPQAHRYIEKQSMDRCISRREMAEIIIRTYH